MRFVFGIIVGFLLTVGAAYVHDASIVAGRADAGRVMVNWEVVGSSLRGINTWLDEQWTALMRTVHPSG